MAGPFALIANPENRRAAYFSEACQSRGLPEPVLLPWAEVLRDDFPLRKRLAEAGALRIESPGENFAVERQMIGLGSDAAREEPTWPSISREAAAALEEDHGRLRLQRQWYHGWLLALAKIESAASSCELAVMNSPSEIAVAFDKAATQFRLLEAGVPIAPNLGICRDFADLRSRMREAGMNRVFLKPCHGSSASGIVALETDGRDRWQATTSAVLTEHSQGVRLHNSLHLQRVRDTARIRQLVDAICRERALAERWIPKASIEGRTYDLRILVIAGLAAHVVVRTSRSPITNLHLGNERGNPDVVRARLGEFKWAAALQTAEAAGACFPGCHYLAVDLMVDSALRRFVVAEVNAFGDLLPRVLWNGMTSWEAELEAWRSTLLNTKS
ncbi:MAG: STM4014 family protein [Verrucomicrobiota bacterium]